MKTDKVVSNLALKICKLRDILEEKDFNKILANLNLFTTVEFEVKRQLNKYIRDTSHELDFTYQDIKALSDEAFSFIQNYQQKFLFDKYYKTLMKQTPIDDNTLKDFSIDIGKQMTVDTVLRAFYKELGYMSLIIWLWSESDDKKTIDRVLLDTLRSFL